MDETDTIYDGKDAGPFYSRESLDADIAAADLILAAIRSPQVIASPKRPDDTELNEALRHVHAAVHLHSEPRQDWLLWIFERDAYSHMAVDVQDASALLSARSNSREVVQLQLRVTIGDRPRIIPITAVVWEEGALGHELMISLTVAVETGLTIFVLLLTENSIVICMTGSWITC
jgi:hypothetical protein